MKHTKEPWIVHYSESDISIGPSGENTGPDFVLLYPGNDTIQKANANRIVTCVNECAGLTTKELSEAIAFWKANRETLEDEKQADVVPCQNRVKDTKGNYVYCSECNCVLCDIHAIS